MTHLSFTHVVSSCYVLDMLGVLGVCNMYVACYMSLGTCNMSARCDNWAEGRMGECFLRSTLVLAALTTRQNINVKGLPLPRMMKKLYLLLLV